MKKLIIMVVAMILCSCGNSTHDRIVNNINSLYQGDTCTIRMSDVTPFDWDKMYVFRESAFPSKINSTLGFKYPFYDDVARRIVFTKSDSIVYHEDQFPYPERRPDDQLEFVFSQDTNAIFFTKKSAIFNVIKNEIDNVLFYELIPIE